MQRRRVDPRALREAVRVPPQPNPPTVQLSVNRSPLQIGEVATFTLTPTDLVVYSPFIFTFRFSDGVQIVKERSQIGITRAFRIVGSYNVSVSVDTPPGSEIFITMPVVTNIVNVQVDSVALYVDPEVVEINQLVTFETKLNTPQQSIGYRFFFGDGNSTDWSDGQVVQHAYSEPGPYTVYAVLGVKQDPFTRSVEKQITVISPPPETLHLSADSTERKTGQAVIFRLRMGKKHDNIRYRFRYGDGNETAWLSQSVSKYAYKAAGTYAASAEAVLNGQMLVSNSVTLIIDAPLSVSPQDGSPFPWYWIVIVGGVALAAAAFQWVRKNRIRKGDSSQPKASAKLIPHIDMGNQQVEVQSARAIRVEIRLRPMLGRGKFSVDTGDNTIIKNERRKNG